MSWMFTHKTNIDNYIFRRIFSLVLHRTSALFISMTHSINQSILFKFNLCYCLQYIIVTRYRGITALTVYPTFSFWQWFFKSPNKLSTNEVKCSTLVLTVYSNKNSHVLHSLIKADHFNKIWYRSIRHKVSSWTSNEQFSIKQAISLQRKKNHVWISKCWLFSFKKVMYDGFLHVIHHNMNTSQ